MQHSASSTSNTTTGTHAPSCCSRTRRAIPSPCTPCRNCDQPAASPSAPPQLPRARPREHATACSTGHLRAQHCRKPPATSRHPLVPTAAPARSPLHPARRVLSNSVAVTSRLLPVANPAGRVARTAINMQARAPRVRPRPGYHLSYA
jgi:hypothetical protein